MNAVARKMMASREIAFICSVFITSNVTEPYIIIHKYSELVNNFYPENFKEI